MTGITGPRIGDATEGVEENLHDRKLQDDESTIQNPSRRPAQPTHTPCQAQKRFSCLSDARASFGAQPDAHPSALSQDTGHGRTETRKATVVSSKALAEHREFPDLKAFGRVEATRKTAEGTTSETRYFVLSWVPTPEVLLATVRAHWAIENSLHWQLDVSFREDAARNRKDNGLGTIAILRRRALDVMRRNTSKGSLSIKLIRAGWDDDFLRNDLNDLTAV
jgi:predicted transposase YbfD/YdcC